MLSLLMMKIYKTKLIKFQDFYDKAQDCNDKIRDLNQKSGRNYKRPNLIM